MRPVTRPAATRRTAIGGALAGAVALTGCDVDRPAGGPAPTRAPTEDADPDTTLVDTVVAELDELVELVTRVAAQRPLLAPALATFAHLHRAHRAVLPDREADVTTPRVTGSVEQVAGRLRQRELQAQRRLADWALAAESGALARLLASMSAGIAAHLADSGLGGLV